MYFGASVSQFKKVILLFSKDIISITLCFEHLYVKEKRIMVSTITLISTTIYNIGNNDNYLLSSKSALQWTFSHFHVS